MPVVQLTDIVARTAKVAPGKRTTLWDKSLPGFGLRVGDQAKTWTVLLGEERRRVTIGHYPSKSVQDARAEARHLLAAAKTARRETGVAAVPFPDALETFVEVHLAEKKQSTAKEWERVLRRHFMPRWKKLFVHEITRAEVAHVIDPLLKAGGEANNAFAVARIFLRWSVRRGYIAHNPMEALRLPTRHKARDRVLSDEELKAVLGTLDTSTSYGTIVLLLLLMAQRRSEIAGLRSEWIDRKSKILTLPPAITKNGLEHAVPLTPLALQLLPEHEGLLFSARRSDRPFNGWSKSMNTLRKACRVDFRLHDLRRTAATAMARHGVPPYVIERILNHITGSTAESITPLARIYNRHRYLEEMRGALLVWEGEVLRLLRECGRNISLLDTGFEPGENLAFDPSDTTWAERDALGKPPGLFEPIDVRG